MKLLKMCISLTLLFNGGAESMETQERSVQPTQPLKVRLKGEQSALDEELYSLLTENVRNQNSEDILTRGQELIKKGADIITSVPSVKIPLVPFSYVDESLATVPLQDVAFNALHDNRNVLPLLLFLENGLDINTFRDKSTTLFLNKQGVIPGASLDTLAKERDRSLENILYWPRGPFHGSLILSGYDDVQKSYIVREWLLRWLIEQGALLDSLDGKGRTPLTFAAESYLSLPSSDVRVPLKSYVIRTLIENGARFDATSYKIKDVITHIYAKKPWIKDLLLTGSSMKSVEALAEGTLLDTDIAELFLIAVGQNSEEVVRKILNSVRYQISMEAIYKGLAVAAQLGNEKIFTELFWRLDTTRDQDQDAVNKALLSAAAQNKSSIISFITNFQENQTEDPLESYKDENQVFEEGEEEPPLKRRRIEPDVPQLFYNPREVIDAIVLDYAIMRSARQGHADIVKMLAVFLADSPAAQRIRKSQLEYSPDRYIYKNDREKQKDLMTLAREKKDLADTLTKSLDLAMIRRHADVVTFLLERFGGIIDNRHPREIVKTILCNPNLSDTEKEDYKKLLFVLHRKYICEQILWPVITGKTQEPSEKKESLLWKSLPFDVIAVILPYLYKVHLSSERL